MSAIQFKVFPPPNNLQDYVECFRLASSNNHEDIAVRVCPNGFPGIAFHYHDGGSAIESITIPLGRNERPPNLFLYGQVTTLSEMRFVSPYTALQVVFKPDTLWSLFGLVASSLTNKSLSAEKFEGVDLNAQLLTASTDEECITACSDFLATKLPSARSNSSITKALEFVDRHISTVDVKTLRSYIGLSERQLERQFQQVVGMSPHLFIRIRRMNAALRLMDSGKYVRLLDVAHALNFHDQSHFIRDIKEFSGLTPKSILQRVDDFYHDQVGTSYLLF